MFVVKYDDIIIVNKKHGLSKDYNPGENPTAKAAFVRLRDDMINQGLNVRTFIQWFPFL